MARNYVFYESQEEILNALQIIRKARLYAPGIGLIFRMCKIGFAEYAFHQIAICYEDTFPIACIVIDKKSAKPDWTCYSDDPLIPNDFLRVNVWVKPKYRRQGIAKLMIKVCGVHRSHGVECFNTGKAAEKLYSILPNSRLI